MRRYRVYMIVNRPGYEREQYLHEKAFNVAAITEREAASTAHRYATGLGYIIWDIIFIEEIDENQIGGITEIKF